MDSDVNLPNKTDPVCAAVRVPEAQVGLLARRSHAPHHPRLDRRSAQRGLDT